MKYTKEEMEKRVMNYLMKTSKHLFLEFGEFYKIMSTKVDDDKWVTITVRWVKDKVDVRVKPISISESPYHTNDLAYLQDYLFPKWERRKSIPNFKEAREKLFEILKIVRKHYDGSKESLVKINELSSEVLSGMLFKDAA